MLLERGKEYNRKQRRKMSIEARKDRNNIFNAIMKPNILYADF